MATVNIGLKLKNAIFFFVNNIIVGKDWGTYILDTSDRDMIITIVRGVQNDKIESDISLDVLLGYLGGGSGEGGTGTIGPQGPMGPVGPKGDKGDTGARGATGLQGAQGVQGLKGDPGVAGSQGPKGEDGAQGLQGPAGDKGDAGPAGIQGPQGPIGLQGEQGIPGIQGPKGEDGSQGIQGPMGPAGGGLSIDTVVNSVLELAAIAGDHTEGSVALVNTNDTQDEDNAKIYVLKNGVWEFLVDMSGATGIQGPQGVDGIQGPKGDKGDQGIQGTQGIQGLTGANGADGIQGPAGADGAKGDKGDQGIQGVKGDTGLQGLPGEQGAQGVQGLKGDKGDTGEQGIQGLQGPAGPAGVDGAPGLEGKDGASAYDLWQIAGNTGPVEEFLASLKGEKGDPGNVGGNIDLSGLITEDAKDALYYKNAINLLISEQITKEDLPDKKTKWHAVSGIVGLKLSSDITFEILDDLDKDPYNNPDATLTRDEVVEWAIKYCEDNMRLDIAYDLELLQRPVLDFPIDGTLLRRISKAHTFEVSRREFIQNFFSRAHVVAPTAEQLSTGLTFNAGERYIYRCSSTDSDGYPAIKFGMSLYDKETNQLLGDIIFNEYSLTNPAAYKRMYFDKNVYTVIYRNENNKLCIGVVDAASNERVGNLVSEITLEDNVLYYLKPYSSGAWYEAVNIYRLWDLNGVVQYEPPISEFYPLTEYKEIVYAVKADDALIPEGDSILESVRIGDTETSAKTGIDIINNSYRMRLGGPNAPITASVKFEIVDSTNAVLGTCTINKENCNIPEYQYFTVFTGYEDWVFYTKDNKVYMSSLNSTVESGEGKELIRFEMIPDASVITGPVLLRMTADGGVHNADINGTVEGYNGQ